MNNARLLDDVRALVGDVGEPCWVAGPTAAALHPFDGFTLRRPFHLTIPRRRNVRRLGVVIHTSTTMAPIDRETVDGLAVTSPTRTLIDLASSSPPFVLAAALDGALRDGLTSEDLLHRRIAELRGKGRFGTHACSTCWRARRSRAVATAGSSESSSGSRPRPGCRAPTHR